MAGLTRGSAETKLALGKKRLRTAADEDALGMALTAIHGALEDYLRFWLHEHPHAPSTLKLSALERSIVTWRDLRADLSQYAAPDALTQELERLIPVFNARRQDVAHGGSYEGTATELEMYAQLVERAVLGGIQPAPARLNTCDPMPPRDSLAAERLKEQKLARLDREWKMEQELYKVADNKGRRRIPTRLSSIDRVWHCLQSATASCPTGVQSHTNTHTTSISTAERSSSARGRSRSSAMLDAMWPPCYGV